MHGYIIRLLKRQRERDGKRREIVDTNQTGTSKERSVAEASKIVRNMELCHLIAQNWPTHSICKAKYEPDGFELVILSRDNCSALTSFHLLVCLLAVGRTLRADCDLFSLRFKDVLAALLTSFPECGVDIGPFILFKVVTEILYQWRARECKAI